MMKNNDLVTEVINQDESQLLEHYHVNSVQELVQIMMDVQKSLAYNHVRTHPIPHIDLQNFTTIKSSIQYKRQLLLNSFYQAHLQMKQKIAKQMHNSSHTQAKSKLNEISTLILSAQQVNKYQKNLIQKLYKRKFKEAIETSIYTYQELLSFFKIKKDSCICKTILRQKYFRGQILQSHKIRKEFWHILSGTNAKKQHYPHLHQALNSFEAYHDFFTRIIHADAIRTVHDADEFTKKQNLQKMQRILKCYARRNPYVGYCQGMNFILSFIMTMGFQQQDCFWILVSIIEDIAPLGYYTNMSGVAIDIKIIQIALKLTHPKIGQKLAKLQIDLSIFVLEWLVCLFTSTLPFYLLVLVWDLLLIQGSLALLKISLVLLEYIGPVIQEAKDFADFFKLYENLKKKIFIEEEIFINKYNCIYIDQQILPLVKEIIEAQLRKSKQELRKGFKDSQKWKQSQCSIDWPVCFQQLKKQKINDIEIDVWVFKDENGPRINQDYLNQKQRKSQKPAEDNREIHKKIVIGRTPHICTGDKAAFKQAYSTDIQLSEIEPLSFQINQKKYSLNEAESSKYQNAVDTSPTDFYKRVTRNSFIFHKWAQKTIS